VAGFQVLIIVGWTPNSDESSASVFSPDSAAIATRLLNSALCCFLFTPTSHASLDRSALSLSDCPENRSRRTLEGLGNWTIEIVKRSDTANGLILLPRRWATLPKVPRARARGMTVEGMERTIAWLNRNRRLPKDVEATIESSVTWHYIASVELMSRRLAAV
jgi:hypothetical protein